MALLKCFQHILYHCLIKQVYEEILITRQETRLSIKRSCDWPNTAQLEHDRVKTQFQSFDQTSGPLHYKSAALMQKGNIC